MFSMRRYFKITVGYKELAKKVLEKTSGDGCTAYAAGMAYYLLFALFPFFLFITTLIGYLPIPGLMDYILGTMQRMLPEQVFTLLQDNIRALFSNKKGGLLSLGFVLALWTSSSAVTSMMDVMNRLYAVKEERPFWKVRLAAIFLVVGLSLLFLASLVLIMFGPKIGQFLTRFVGLGVIWQYLWNILLVPVILFLLGLAVAIVYYFTPDVDQNWKWITPGSVVAVPIWIVASIGFAYYVNNFGSYNKTYGSIGAVIVLLLWFYISSFILLLGAEINGTVEHLSVEGKEPGEKVEDEHEQHGDMPRDPTGKLQEERMTSGSFEKSPRK